MGFSATKMKGPRGSDVVKGSRMAVIDPSEPDAGTKKGGKSERLRVIHLLAGGLSLSTIWQIVDGITLPKSIGGFSAPHASTDAHAHDATEMQADPRRC